MVARQGKMCHMNVHSFLIRVHSNEYFGIFFSFKASTLRAANLKIIEFANSIDPDEVAHYEPPHLYLHCLPSSL